MQTPQSPNQNSYTPPGTDLIFNHMPGNHLLLVPDAPRFTIAAVSDEYLAAVGTDRHLLVGHGLFEVFFGDGRSQQDSSLLQDSLQQVIRTGQTHRMADQFYRYNHPETGHPRAGLWRLANKPVIDASQQVAYIIHTVEDITQAVELSEARQHKKYYQTILNLCKEPIQVLEPVFANGDVNGDVNGDATGEIVDFRFVLANQAYASYANTTPEQLEGKRVGEVFPGYFETASFTHPVETYRTGRPLTFEIHYDKDGLDLYNSMSTFRLDSQVVVHFTDFTKLKQLQLQLEGKIDELRHSNQQLEDFAHAASHDLKEPIRKIQSFAKLLKSTLGDKLSETESALFERMFAATLRMNTLIDSLLAYSELGRQAIVCETVALDDVVSQVLTDLELEMENARATVRVGPLCTIQGHRRQWEQAFQNLLGNALKYARADQRPRIEIDCQTVGGSAVPVALGEQDRQKEFHLVRITDNGIGFAQQDAARIFNMFTRLHGVSEYKGSGIGLSTVKKVVTNHRGYIWAESEPGQGASFYILLPKN